LGVGGDGVEGSADAELVEGHGVGDGGVRLEIAEAREREAGDGGARRTQRRAERGVDPEAHGGVARGEVEAEHHEGGGVQREGCTGGGGAVEAPAGGGVAYVEIGGAIVLKAEAEGVGGGAAGLGQEADEEAGASDAEVTGVEGADALVEERVGGHVAVNERLAAPGGVVNAGGAAGSDEGPRALEVGEAGDHVGGGAPGAAQAGAGARGRANVVGGWQAAAAVKTAVGVGVAGRDCVGKRLRDDQVGGAIDRDGDRDGG